MEGPTFPAAVGMWLLMTGLMMTPVVLPWLRTLRHLNAGVAPGPTPAVAPFALGYAVAWGLFSVGAAWIQVRIAGWGWSTPLLTSTPMVAGAALILIGGYQFTRLKASCLTHCRSPAGYLLDHWRKGPTGAFRMGLGHGLFCLGCCWTLMLVGLVVGAMNLAWMGLLAAIMIVETTGPFGARITRPVGALLVMGGLAALLP
ncbi:MAG: DUF2182 domain-containing protein [Longimicrobiales bacterium]